MRRIFREWPSHIGRDARSQARVPLRSPSWKALPLPGSLKASRKMSLFHRFRPVPGYGACRLCRACAVKRMAEAGSGTLPREDNATAMQVLSLPGKPSASWSGRAVSTLIRKVPGLRRYRPGRFVREAAMTNVGPLADAALHIPACVCNRHGALWQAAFRVAAHSVVDADPQGSRQTRWTRGLPEVMGVEKKADRRRRRVFVLCAPKERGRKDSVPTQNVSRALNPPPARYYPAWPYAARCVRASCSAARPSPSRS
jgi:hypothetical protein